MFFEKPLSTVKVQKVLAYCSNTLDLYAKKWIFALIFGLVKKTKFEKTVSPFQM